MAGRSPVASERPAGLSGRRKAGSGFGTTKSAATACRFRPLRFDYAMKALTVRGRVNRREPQMQRFRSYLETVRRYGQKLGPYLMLEIVLPGGTLFALLLFLYQRRKISSALSISGSAERL